MRTTIIILNWNGKDLIKGMLDSIEHLRKRYKIMVVDNGSTDQSQELIKERYPWVKLIELKNNTGSAGWDYGIKETSTEYFTFLGNDIELEDDTIKKLEEALDSNDKIAAAVPKIIDRKTKKVEFSGEMISRAMVAREIVLESSGKPYDITGVGCALMRTALIKEIGGLYDPDFFLYAEDFDLGLRIRLAGYMSVLVPDAIIYHSCSTTTHRYYSSPQLVYTTEKNLLLTFFKNTSSIHMVLWSPYLFLIHWMLIGRDLVLMRFSHVMARIKAMLWILSHPILIHQKRRQTRKMRKMPDRYVFAHFSEKWLLKEFFRKH